MGLLIKVAKLVTSIPKDKKQEEYMGAIADQVLTLSTASFGAKDKVR